MVKVFEATDEKGVEISIKPAVARQSATDATPTSISLTVTVGPRGVPHPSRFHDPLEEGVDQFQKTIPIGETLRLVVEP